MTNMNKSLLLENVLIIVATASSFGGSSSAGGEHCNAEASQPFWGPSIVVRENEPRARISLYREKDITK